MRRGAIVRRSALVSLVAAWVLTAVGVGHTDPAVPGWLMFHHDGQHTGLAAGHGLIPHDGPPAVRWKFPLFAPLSNADAQAVRWAASFPLGDLDGDGTLETVVTSPDNVPGLANQVVVVKDDPSRTKGYRILWRRMIPVGASSSNAGIDQYSAALADADGDGRPDVIITSADGVIRALDGDGNGALLWKYSTRRSIESGPMLADLNGNGSTQVIVTTSCVVATCGNDPHTSGGEVFVFDAKPAGGGPGNPPLWRKRYVAKMDSGPPAVADLDPNDGRSLQQLVFGGWDGRLHVAWHDGSATVDRSYNLLRLDPSLPSDTQPVVRTAPLITDFGSGPTALFGWMPSYLNDAEARMSAIGLRVNTLTGRVRFTPRWSPAAKVVDTWKSSPALVPAVAGTAGDDQPVVAEGYGIDPAPGTFVTCGQDVFGGVVGVNPDGSEKWRFDLRDRYGTGFGSVRASPAVADIDNDGRPDVVVAAGCKGDLYALDGQTGQLEWSFPLGPYTIPAPSIGDLDGDGTLEIVQASYDGNVYALGA